MNRRDYYQYKISIDKSRNNKTANRIQIINNRVIDDLIESGASAYLLDYEFLYNELWQINKPVVTRNYRQFKTADIKLDAIKHNTLIRAKTGAITEQELLRIARNVKTVSDIIQKYDVDVERYKQLSKTKKLSESRKGIINRSIKTENILTSRGMNIPPNTWSVGGYQELNTIAETLTRNSQITGDFDTAQLANEEAEAKGEPRPYNYKKWIWTDEGQTTRHESNDGQTVDIDEPFIITNDATGDVDEMMFPTDPDADPSNSFICYCDMEIF